MSGLIQIEPQTITVKLSCGCEYVLGNLGREHNPCPNDEGQCPKCRRKVVVEGLNKLPGISCATPKGRAARSAPGWRCG